MVHASTLHLCVHISLHHHCALRLQNTEGHALDSVTLYVWSCIYARTLGGGGGGGDSRGSDKPHALSILKQLHHLICMIIVL